jgi:hypothetical protein
MNFSVPIARRSTSVIVTLRRAASCRSTAITSDDKFTLILTIVGLGLAVTCHLYYIHTKQSSRILSSSSLRDLQIFMSRSSFTRAELPVPLKRSAIICVCQTKSAPSWDVSAARTGPFFSHFSDKFCH